MIKTVAAVTGAAVLAGTVVLLSGMTAPPAAALAPPTVAPGKGDRLDIRRFGPDCSERAWPYFEAGCIRGAAAKPVRMVRIDRLPGDGAATAH